MAIERTSVECVYCTGEIVREFTRTPVGPVVYGGSRPTELGPVQQYCENCGLMYLPKDNAKADDPTPPRAT